MNRPLHVGIAGAGLMGFWHARTAQKAGAKVVVVSDRDQTAAQKVAQRFPGAQTYIGDTLPPNPEPAVDVWHICTPLSSHLQLAEAALISGSHVLVEKPLVPTTAETNHLLSLAEQQRLLICPVHQFPFQHGAQQTLKHLPKLEPLTGFHYTVRSAGGTGLSTEETAQIALSILPHPLSMIAGLLPVQLEDISWQVTKPHTAEWLIIGHAGGIGISIEISMKGRPTTNHCQLVGQGGTARLDLFHGYAIFEGGLVSRTRKILHPFQHSARHLLSASLNIGRRAIQGESAYPGLRTLIRAFYSAIQNGTPNPIPPRETLAIARVSEQIQNQAVGQT
jgi:predicted dehydrogenase